MEVLRYLAEGIKRNASVACDLTLQPELDNLHTPLTEQLTHLALQLASVMPQRSEIDARGDVIWIARY